MLTEGSAKTDRCAVLWRRCGVLCCGGVAVCCTVEALRVHPQIRQAPPHPQNLVLRNVPGMGRSGGPGPRMQESGKEAGRMADRSNSD